ncbi:hypothetical protein [Pseudooceanicola sp. LIPI14-2-Ac024]|uniref:hypothetical protein n=1 Tax=Pseudooceanicola sp. LIPI14-2-Ac024 TaxID=3344875 RepID=UPI0035CFF960
MSAETGPRFQVIGERSSGTNFVSALIGQNIPVPESQIYGWKHGFPQFLVAPADVTFVVVTRDALSWMKSMYRKPWHTSEAMQRLSFQDFLRAEWDTRVDRHFMNEIDRLPEFDQPLQWDRHPVEGRTFHNMAELRSVKLAAHLGLRARTDKMLYLRHQDVVADPEAALDQVSAMIGVPRCDQFVLPEDHYGWQWNKRREWLKGQQVDYSEADIDFVNGQLDWAVEAAAGYEPPTPQG